MAVNSVIVKIWGLDVGYLSWDEQNDKAVFSYTEDFPAKGLNIAPLEKSIDSPSVRLPLSGNSDKLYMGLPRFIADSLPDRWGNKVFEAWASRNNIPKRKLTPIDRLSFIGSRGMGALEYQPSFMKNEEAVPIAAAELAKTALDIQADRRQVLARMNDDSLLEDIYRVGTSAGGKRAKAIIAMNEDGDIRSGQVSLPDEYKYYILKFNDAEWFPFPEVEMAYYRMACEAGIDMMPSRLMTIENKQHFLTERFDRQEGKKLHLLTLAAMADYADSYEDLFAVMRLLRLPKAQHQQMFRRMVFNVLGGNVDDHTKNFSFLMTDKGLWGITPAYDMLFSIDVDAPDYANRHAMSVCGKKDNITHDDLLQFAKMNDIRQPEQIILQVKEALVHWDCFAMDACVPAKWQTIIDEYIKENVRQSCPGG